MQKRNVDDVLWDIRNRIYGKLGNTIETDVAIDPLKWYINTGRSPYDFERRLKACSSRQLTTIANRLIKQSRRPYNTIINSISVYIGVDSV